MTASMWARQPRAIRLGAAFGVSVAAAGLLAACSSASSTSSTPAAVATSGSATSLVITTKTSSAGPYLTNASGRAIYLWAKDGKDSSACLGGCATAWPPVTATGALSAAGGVDKAGLSTFTRSDGTKQVAYDGHALYYFSKDPGPGEVSGQGIDAFGAKWWLVDPAGTAITSAVTVSSGATPSASASSKGGGGY